MKKNSIFFALLCCLLSFSSCNDEDEADSIRTAIAGTWQLSSVVVDGNNLSDLSAYPEFVQFQSNSIFQTYDKLTDVKERGGWSYENDMLNISIYLPAAYYVLKVDAQYLSLKRFDFNVEGALSTTIQEYERSVDSEIP